MKTYSALLLLFALPFSAKAYEQVWTIETQDDWKANAAAQTNLEFKDGRAVPTAPSAMWVGTRCDRTLA